MDFGQLLNLEDFSIISFAELAARFAFNAIMAAGIILLVYRRHSNNKDFCFTLFSFNLIIFALCTILNNVDLSIGSGFGLFAVFTMMRYRSEQLQIKDMTYLLILIGLGFVNATVSDLIGPLDIVFLNISIGLSMLILEKTMLNHHLVNQKIKYNNLELIKVENRPLMKKDLESKLGAIVQSIRVESINFADQSAILMVKYNPQLKVRSNHYILNEQQDTQALNQEKEALLMNGT